MRRGTSAFDPPRSGGESLRDRVNDQSHTVQTLLIQNVAGRLLKYSTESTAGCDTTIPVLDSVLFFSAVFRLFCVLKGLIQCVRV